MTAVDEQGEVRAVELPEHPFFLATLFQPERSALAGNRPHPLIAAFVEAARAHAAGEESAHPVEVGRA
jgi:CTP synthase (UTP-ammonia lyase)